MAVQKKDDKKQDSANPNPNPEPNPNPAPTAQFVPLDDFKRLEDTINSRFQQFQDNFNAILTRVSTPSAPTPSAPDEPDVSISELEAALAEGKGADKFIKATENRLKKIEKAFTTRLEQLETSGVGAITNLSKEVALSSKPYYKEYKKEIDQTIDQLPANVRMNPEVYSWAYNAVIGAHIDDIKAREREAILREAANPDDATLPNGKNGRGQDHDEGKVPTVEELFGREAAQALEAVGRTPDQQAQRLGHKDWQSYAAWVKEQEQANADARGGF